MEPSPAGAFAGLFIVGVSLVVTFLIFLLMREVWCWYWKLNSLLGELKLIRGLLERAEQRATPPDRSSGPTRF